MSIYKKYVCVECGKEFEEWRSKCSSCNGTVVKVVIVERLETSRYD